MAGRAVSPGAALLRTSRLFSLPAPLTPPGDVSGGSPFHSPTATTTYPQHQAITTPQSARSRGDWGLKRQLPLKSTAHTSTPLIRVKQVDSIEHITDFASAADHGLSLKKWQEMNLPISVPERKVSMQLKPPAKSVFEEEGDFTAIDPAKEAKAQDLRWKFRGPWLAGITEGRFQQYLEKEVRAKRPEFRQFLRVQLAAEMDQENQQQSLSRGTDPMAPVPTESITDEQLTEYTRRLRSDRPKLYDMVGKFLDLAPIKPDSVVSLFGNWSTKEVSAGNPYATEGPPITHPSAGISYLRTDAYMDNHPIYGPQKAHPPIKARIVMPRMPGRSSKGAKLGVGGFIAETPDGNSIFNVAANSRSGELVRGNSRFDPDLVGGAKAYVHPWKANVDSQGRVVVEVSVADPMASLVAQELLGEAKILGQEEAQAQDTDEEPALPRRRQNTKSVMGSSESYGLSGMRNDLARSVGRRSPRDGLGW